MICCLLSLGPLVATARAELAAGSESRRPEVQVKAAFLFNFAKLTEWPAGTFADEDQPLAIGVLGQERMARALDRMLRGKRAHGRYVEVRRFDSLEQVEDCHLLFFGGVSDEQLVEILELLGRRPMLTVADGVRMRDHGPAIRLSTEEGQVEFEVNTVAASRSGLRLSSRLLSLAKAVYE